MAKQTFKVKCDQVNQNTNQGSVRFVIEAEPAAPAPGQPPQRRAKFIAVLNYADPAAASKFEVGKNYTITVE